MPPRFDDEAFVLRLSAADLLERELVRQLGFANRGGYERLWVGQAIHSRYQEAAMAEDPTYRREVSLEVRFSHRGWEIQLHGRLDGLRRDRDGRLWIEEIKSVRPGSPPQPATSELYRRQALLYAWMLSQIESEPVFAELVLIEIGSGDLDRQSLEADVKGLEAGIKRRLSALLDEHEREREAREHRRQAAGRLVFPFFRARPGQDLIMEEVERALEAGEHLLIEAPTGLGKTAATLFPVLRFALAHDKRVFVLTAKTLQQDMATRVLELLDRDGDFHALRLRAKARMCANDEVLCHEEYCPYAKDYALKLHQSALVRRLLDEYPILHPDAVYEAARTETVCPFEVSLELGRSVQVVVGDYNYAFEPYVALSDFGVEEDLSDAILVIDEIHNLVDRGRGYYSPRLFARSAREVAEWAATVSSRGGGEDRALAGRLEGLAAALERVVVEHVEESLGDSSDGAAESTPPEDLLWQLRPAFDRAFVDYLEHRRETKSFRSEDPFVGLYFDFLRYLNTLEIAHGEAFSHYVRREAGECSIAILCKDASAFLGRTLNRCHAAIGLSATLSPPEFYRDLLGFDPARTSEISLTNPFPPEHRRIVVDAAVTTVYRRRSENYAPIARRLSELAQSVPGNCLALFPSYQFLAEVAERLDGCGKRLLIQRRADSEEERQQILDALRSSLFGDALLLAVAGGVFAEGVDYPGEMLQAVAVVGPCLPAVTLEQKLLEAYYEDRFERGFEYAFVVPGMTRVVQAAGRLIRSAEDKGIIALFDRRFLQDPYRRHLPQDWLPEEGANALVGHPATVAASFFRLLAGT